MGLTVNFTDGDNSTYLIHVSQWTRSRNPLPFTGRSVWRQLSYHLGSKDDSSHHLGSKDDRPPPGSQGRQTGVHKADHTKDTSLPCFTNTKWTTLNSQHPFIRHDVICQQIVLMSIKHIAYYVHLLQYIHMVSLHPLPLHDTGFIASSPVWGQLDDVLPGDSSCVGLSHIWYSHASSSMGQHSWKTEKITL